MLADEEHIDTEVTERVYPDGRCVRRSEQSSREVGDVQGLQTHQIRCPKELAESAQLGRSLWKRRTEIVAYFDACASNGPVEAINGRLECLPGIALGFRNLEHYILRSLIHSGQLQENINVLS